MGEYLPHHLHDSPDYLCVFLVRQEDITKGGPRYGHPGRTPTLERLLVVDQQGPTRINVISTLKLTVVGYSSVKYYYFQVQQSPYTSPS